MKFTRHFNLGYIISIFLCSNLSWAMQSSEDDLKNTNVTIKQKKFHKKEKSSAKDPEVPQLKDYINDSYEKKLSSLNAQFSALTAQIADSLVKINENNALLTKRGLPPTIVPCFQEIDILRSLAATENKEDQQNHIAVSTFSYPSFYNDFIENFVLYEEVKRLHSASMPQGDVKIIDAGGGTGLLARHLKAEDPRREIEIFDLNDDMTRVAIEKGMNPTNIHISTITDLRRSNNIRVPDDSIDGIMTNHVLYQLSLEEVNQFFTEAYRVLKKDGVLSIASMQTVEKEKMDEFTHFLKSETKKMEDNGNIWKGFSNLFFACRQTLLDQNSSTTFTGHEIVALGRSKGFQETALNETCYMGTVFFVSFQKLLESNP